MSADDAAPTPRSLLEPAATRVRDPVSGRSAWLARVVRDGVFEADGTLAFDLAFTDAHDAATRASLTEAVVANLRGLGFEGPVAPRVVGADVRPRGSVNRAPVPGMAGPGMAPHGGPIVKQAVRGVRHVVAVASGKGGVGKSTVAANLAVALRRRGHAVGLLDADVHGPSVPILMNTSQKPEATDDGFLVPVNAYGVRTVSMGQLTQPTEAMIWRGPMVQGVVRQFLQQVHWGELDVLLVDMPPGTGDAQLTLVQATPLSGAVIVTTPQEVALADAVRGLEMFRRLDVPLLGLVENMAYYLKPDGTKDFVFGRDGGKLVAERFGVDVIGELPLQTAIRKGSDQGLPPALGKGAVSEAFAAMADAIADKLGITA